MNIEPTNSQQNDHSPQNYILVVDDVPENIQLLSILLKKSGYQVKGVNSGKMALEAVKQMPPQLILLDVMMPDIDGYEVCQRLKNLPETSQIPIIFLSALENIENKQKAFEVGGNDYISKPFKFEEVLMRVKNQLKLWEAQNQIKQLNEQLEERVQQRTAQLEREINQHRQTQEKLYQIAFYDSLTGLPNRTLFLELLQNSIQRSQQDEHYSFSVLFLDCDRFKLVNDSLGHQVGDQLLKQVAFRLQSCIRPVDTLARFGGDEFIVILEDLDDLDFTKMVAQRLIEKLKQPFRVKERDIFLGASLGLILDTKHYQSPETILRDAEMAMYRAKESGKACYQIFESEMHLLAQKHLQLETDFRLALQRQEFIVYYQPLFCFRTNRIKGFEALVRWNHPEKGLLSPMNFMPLAEETGLIVPLGLWVLREACYQLKTWQQQKFGQENLTMSVNLSVKQFAQEDLIENIEAIIAQSKIKTGTLTLEITETALMDNNSLAQDVISELRKLNISLSIDDFGTGYSSLSYLHQFPVEQLKIDRSFIQSMNRKTDNINIIETIITLAKNLKMQIVAEGIETQMQFNRLKNLECDFGQGYFFSKPLPSESIDALLDSFFKSSLAC
jgi:diguanylate cyclase (GGDEF)-like protein